MELNKFLDFKYLSNIHSTPNKSKISYLVATTNYDKNEYNYELYETDGTKNKRIIKLGNKPAFVYEDDNNILFPFTKGKEEKKLKEEYYNIYYRYNIETKKRDKAYKFNLNFEIAEVLNAEFLLLKGTFTNGELALLHESDRKESIKTFKQNKAYEVIDELPFYFNGPGFINNKFTYLFLYNIKDESYKMIHDDNLNISSFKVNKKKNEITIITNKKVKVSDLVNQVYLYNYKTHENKVLYDKDEYSVRAIYFLNDETIFYASNKKPIGLNSNGSFYTIKNNDFNLLSKFFYSVGNSIGSDVRLGGSKTHINFNDKIYFTATIDDHSEIYSLDEKGNINQEFIIDGSVDGLCTINDKIYGILLHKQKLQEVYEIDKKIKQVSRFNSRTLKDHYVAKPKLVVYKEKDFEVKGYVLLPKGYDENKKYPAILDIHGGPKTVYGKVYYHEMQAWANMGYFVFFCNPRGSDGKGDEFSDIRGKYGTIDYEDIMNFTNKVLNKYKQIDQNELFVTGGSYGGFMTNWIVGHTNMFKRAVTQRSISNWISFFGTSDIGFYFAKDQVDGHPNLDTDKLWEQSPLKYAMNVETPLLFIHSDADYRCPMEQAVQFYGILKEKGLETKLVWFKNETHELSRSGKPQARLKRLEEITNWFKK